MPYCDVGHYKRQYQQRKHPNVLIKEETEPVSIFYQLYGHGSIKVLLVMGLAATHDAWGPQIVGLTGTNISNEEKEVERGGDMSEISNRSPDESFDLEGIQEKRSDIKDSEKAGRFDAGIQVCCFDNRGVGKSSMPMNKSDYTTTIMAMDALALMDHLGWEKAHVFGHSMGAMISCKLAAMVPDRITSLALISGTGGGYQCFPKVDRKTISIVIRLIRAKNPEERAHVDLDTHYTKEYLDAIIGGVSRRALLYKEYVKNITSSGMQPKHGLNGQMNACWTHQITSNEFEMIRSSGIFVSVIHGRGDIIAQIRYSRAIAEKLHPVARMVELPGGHFVTHQDADEVNQELLELIEAAQSNVYPSKWSKNASITAAKGWGVSRTSSIANYEAEGEEDESSCCFTFLTSLHKRLILERCSPLSTRLVQCFSKQKQ